jgi:hypothetical protein
MYHTHTYGRKKITGKRAGNFKKRKLVAESALPDDESDGVVVGSLNAFFFKSKFCSLTDLANVLTLALFKLET